MLAVAWGVVRKMSIEAVAWALRQKIPPKPKIALIALADQADERSGRVCYGKTDLGHISTKCSIPERSLTRYFAALIRNGYLIRESGKAEGRASQYWLCLDRAQAEDYDDWKWTGDAPSEEPEDLENSQDIEGSATMADPPDDAENGRPGRPHMDGPARVSCLTKEHPRAREARPPSFSRAAQDLERGVPKETAAEESKRFFVIDGSRAWEAWCQYQRSCGKPGTLPTCAGQGKHVGKRGWWMPSLFPPPIGPPREPSEQDLKEFT